MDERTVQSLRATLAADRGALRRVRNRLIHAEGALLPALEEWQDEGEPVARGHLRWVAGRRAKDVRRARRTLRGAIAAVRLMRAASPALRRYLAGITPPEPTPAEKLEALKAERAELRAKRRKLPGHVDRLAAINAGITRLTAEMERS